MNIVSLYNRAFVAAGILMLASLPASAQDKKLTVQIWANTWQSAIQAVSEAFRKETGIAVQLVTQSSSGEGLVKLQAMKQKPTVDVWFTTSSVAKRASQDTQLFAPIPTKSVPNLSQLDPAAHDQYWVAAYYYPIGIIYRPDMVKEPITKWQDLWDQRFENKLALPNMNMYQASMLLVAAQLNGGGVDNVEPGFQALAKLRPNIALFYGSDSPARQALAQGEAAVLVAPPSQAKRVRDQGIDVKMVSPKPAPMFFDVMMIVKSGNEANAARFIDFVSSTAMQRMISEKLEMGPVNRNAEPAPAMAASLPKQGDGVAFDDAKINANIAAWNERFNREIAR